MPLEIYFHSEPVRKLFDETARIVFGQALSDTVMLWRDGRKQQGLTGMGRQSNRYDLLIVEIS